MAGTATAIDRGQTDLVLLCIDERGLQVVEEDCYEAGEAYPHVYQPVPVASVVAVAPFPCARDGSFVLPLDLPT